MTERLLREKALELGLDILDIDILLDHVHLFSPPVLLDSGGHALAQGLF